MVELKVKGRSTKLKTSSVEGMNGGVTESCGIEGGWLE